MSLRCQVAPYEREFSTKVVSITPRAIEIDIYDVVLEDTVLFPEGFTPHASKPVSRAGEQGAGSRATRG